MSKQWTKTGSREGWLVQFIAVSKWEPTPFYLRWLGYGAQRRQWFAISQDFDQWQYANLIIPHRTITGS